VWCAAACADRACLSSCGSRSADEISGDLFDLLIGLGDFEEFKSLMLSFKDQVEGERAIAAGRPAGAFMLDPSLRPSARPSVPRSSLHSSCLSTHFLALLQAVIFSLRPSVPMPP
jgi:hypothetical protein